MLSSKPGGGEILFDKNLLINTLFPSTLFNHKRMYILVFKSLSQSEHFCKRSVLYIPVPIEAPGTNFLSSL